MLASLVAGVFCVTPNLCMSSPKNRLNTMEDQSSGGQGSCEDQCQKGRLLSFCPKAVVSMLQGEMSHLHLCSSVTQVNQNVPKFSGGNVTDSVGLNQLEFSENVHIF